MLSKNKANVVHRSRSSTARYSGKSVKEGDAMSVIVVLVELLGEAIHMVLINASELGALVSDIRAWLSSHRK